VLSTVFSRLGGYASPQQFVDGLQPAVLVGSGVVALGALAALFVPGLRALRPRTVAPVSLGGHEKQELPSDRGGRVGRRRWHVTLLTRD